MLLGVHLLLEGGCDPHHLEALTDKNALAPASGWGSLSSIRALLENVPNLDKSHCLWPEMTSFELFAFCGSLRQCGNFVPSSQVVIILTKSICTISEQILPVCHLNKHLLIMFFFIHVALVTESFSMVHLQQGPTTQFRCQWGP